MSKHRKKNSPKGLLFTVLGTTGLLSGARESREDKRCGEGYGVGRGGRRVEQAVPALAPTHAHKVNNTSHWVPPESRINVFAFFIRVYTGCIKVV